MVMKGVLDRVWAAKLKEAEDVRPYTVWTDEERVSAAQRGEEEAFGQIISRYQGKIYSYVYRLTNHGEEATDITQDVFVKAYKHLQTVDTERKFSSWLYRIAHNESVNWLKKKSRARIESLEAHVEQGHQVASKSDVAAQYMQEEEQRYVREAIDQLPARYRQVMELRYIHQHSYQEISVALDKPLNTVGTLINRAKRLMQELLQDQKPQ